MNGKPKNQEERENLAEEIYRVLDVSDPLTVKFIQVWLGLTELFDRKQRSYGPGNITQLGGKGVFVRAFDKIQRLKQLIWERKTNSLEDESRRDTWGDLANYAVIWLLVDSGAWPRVGEESDGLE